ncbi:hypothetical protein QKU48_gp1369 [Fadolivirus algeromassiliense]|jgi:hypothetical protein|uniref:Uncharacterized protein n=1 Tax=Fadolivirus FV1/VV64 TaxID=3070911 RepID=A0A7D3QVD1_9VIRU|nr:hypothetical protein QKU48_gp1369 [Fadolivirus algeromassiliense]QKF94827.1 hypothetical protein Fadolivirus_1_1369 [Fadolivirus FV1/VV64]
MGRYFGIGNKTKQQTISSYWKADEWCNCYEVMHQFHWEPTDMIYSGAYDTYCEFRYNEETDEMECIDKTDEIMNSCCGGCCKDCNESEESHESNEADESDESNEDCNNTCCDDPDNCKSCVNENKPEPISVKNAGRYGFDEGYFIKAKDKYNHVPKWNGNVCEKCGFQYSEEQLEKSKQKFDGVFHFN